MTTKNTKRGAVTIIFLMILALIITLLLAATQSRLLLSLRRSQSAGDNLVAAYRAESEANDIMAKLVGGYLATANINPPTVLNIDGMKIEISGEDDGETQVVDVVVNRDFAVSAVRAVREIKSVKKVDFVEIIIALDCTSSMDEPSGFANQTRFNAQEEAAISFIETLSDIEDADKFRVGVSVFGINGKWLEFAGEEVTPENEISFSNIVSAIRSGFGNNRATSPACSGVMDATSVGTAFTFSHDYFREHEAEGVKQIEIVITDGEPNSRIPEPGCSPNVFCPAFPISPDGSTDYCQSNEYGWTCHQRGTYEGAFEEDNFNPVAYGLCQPLAYEFLKCAVADTDDTHGDIGIRNPEVDAYAVTIFANPPLNVVNIFRKNTSENGYYNASRASQLKNILNIILNEILTERSTVTIKRVIPN